MPIDFQNVGFVYNKKSPLEFEALKGIDLRIEEGSFTALIGRTGCGKSTLIQHINALLYPSSGLVTIDEFKNSSNRKERSKKVKDLRRNVGLVFQFPEYQLFEETVLKDVCFGPKNFGMKKEEAEKAAKEALEAVGLGEEFYERSPFELSGGEKRRVAIAGILAIKPKYLIVDEPTAGLDPLGGKAMMDLFKKIHEAGTTVILVTHDMDVVISYCDTVVVLDDGKIARIAKPLDLFAEDLERYSLETPAIFRFLTAIKSRGVDIDPASITDIESLAKAIAALKEKK